MDKFPYVSSKEMFARLDTQTVLALVAEGRSVLLDKNLVGSGLYRMVQGNMRISVIGYDNSWTAYATKGIIVRIGSYCNVAAACAGAERYARAEVTMSDMRQKWHAALIGVGAEMQVVEDLSVMYLFPNKTRLMFSESNRQWIISCAGVFANYRGYGETEEEKENDITNAVNSIAAFDRLYEFGPRVHPGWRGGQVRMIIGGQMIVSINQLNGCLNRVRRGKRKELRRTYAIATMLPLYFIEEL